MIDGIHRLETEEQLRECVEVLQDAFETVAAEFGLTVDNCPSNAAFVDFGKLKSTLNKGVEYFGYYVEGRMNGCVGIKKKADSVYEISKLAVRKLERGQSIGAYLLEYVIEQSRMNQGSKMVLGLIDDDKVLKEWYIQRGFRISNRKKFKGLPFWVCFMEMPLS